MQIENISQYISMLAQMNLDGSRQLYFRGHSSFKFNLKPNLYREENYYINEDQIYKETIVNSPQEFYQYNKTIEILVKMQHYGIPTRLLDVTRNPLVALYFACYENENIDGEVVMLNIPIKHVKFFDSDKVAILANLAKQQVDFGFDYKLDFDYSSKGDVKKVNHRYFGYLLHSIKEDKPHFYNIINPVDVESVLAVQVKLDNPRIIKQNGAFLIFGVKKSVEGTSGKTNCADVDNDWILASDNNKVIVPKESKQSILNELNLIGISRSTLFPELDDFANYLKNKYNLPTNI